jgi:hypothetical protein
MSNLEEFRHRVAGFRAYTIAEMNREIAAEQRRFSILQGRPLPIIGGAPQLQTTLAELKAAVTKNTFTGPATILGADNVGPFSMDWFNNTGAIWEQESMGILSSTGTPTIIFRTAFGSVPGTIATSLCVAPTITTASGVANADWYYFVIGRIAAASGSTSTMLVSGNLINNINALATIATQFIKNATPPTAVTTDLSTGTPLIDLQVTWSASSVSNTITTNHYRLSALWTG